MRASLRASSTVAWVALAVAALGCAASRTQTLPPPREPPPRVLDVNLERIALRESAYLEVHAALAASARAHGTAAATESTRSGYAGALSADAADVLLRRTFAALAPCLDDPCAARALDGSPLAEPFASALAPFVARDWTEAAKGARAGIEAVRASFGAEAEALLLRVARDLGIAWPAEVVVVPIVATPIPPGPEAPLPPVLAARGPCFARARGAKQTERMHDARIIDCVLAYAALGQAAQSSLFAELARSLPPDRAERAWTVLVVHAVAATVTAWEPKHASVLRRSAEAVTPTALAWLADNWRSRAHGESAASFAARYAEEMR